MTSTESYDWEYLLSLLPDGRDELAASHGIRFRTRHNAQLQGIDQLLRIYLNKVANGLSLETATVMAEGMGLPRISKVALHLRARKLAPFLAELLKLTLDLGDKFVPERWAGYEVVIVDGTTCVRPGADRATARILYAMRLGDLQVVDLLVSDDSKGETFKRFDSINAGQLWIGDRVYANPGSVAAIHDKQADVLIRHNWASLPLFDSKGDLVDVFKKLDQIRKKPRDWKVWVDHEGQLIPGRLIIEKLPAADAKRARKKLKKENPLVSKKVVRTAGFRMIFTTVPPDRLSKHDLLALYVLRWQIELRIKRDKSIHDLDELPNIRGDTIASWIYAKLLITELTRRVSDAARDLSPSGAAQQALAA